MRRALCCLPLSTQPPPRRSPARFLRQSAHEILKHPPTLLVILELVETRTRRSQQHHVSSPRSLGSHFNRARQRFGALQRHAASANLLFNLLRSCPNQQRHNRLFPQRLLQHRVVATLILATQNDQHPPGKRIQRLQRCIHIRGLRIVVVAHPADLCDKLQPVFHPPEI